MLFVVTMFVYVCIYACILQHLSDFVKSRLINVTCWIKGKGIEANVGQEFVMKIGKMLQPLFSL